MLYENFKQKGCQNVISFFKGVKQNQILRNKPSRHRTLERRHWDVVTTPKRQTVCKLTNQCFHLV